MRIFRANAIDLIMTAVMIPSIEAVVELRRKFPQIKLIALPTRYRMKDTVRVLLQNLGAQRTLPKPFVREELLEVVRSLLAADA